MVSIYTFAILLACTNALPLESDVVFKTNCALSLLDEVSPLIIKSGKSEFIYPKIGETSLGVNSGDSVDLVCPGKKVDIGFKSYADFTTATCISGSTLEIDGKKVQWRNIKCSASVVRSARLSGNKCAINGNEVEVGFAIGDRFLKTILICFDQSSQEALYSQAKIIAVINQRIADVSRPSWAQGSGIYDIKHVDSYYGRIHQRKVVNSLLGLPESSTKYIQNNNNYLARGHMSARSDHFYPAQENSTFFLFNVAPQWQTCNANNWYQVEAYVRDYAEAHKVDLLLWTGVYGVTTLPHEKTGKSVELYLYNEDNKKNLPVPEFFWKVAYEPNSQKGIVFIVINNPYIDTFKPMCDDVSNKVEGLNWQKDDNVKGFGYICTVDSFRKVVDSLPKFTDKGLLV